MTEPPLLALKARYLLLSIAVLVLDQWSKWMVDAHLPEHGAGMEVEIIPGLLNFIHVKNTGVAFGFLAGVGESGGVWMLVGMSLVALVLVLGYFWTVPRGNRLLHTALALVLGGAVGNLLDRAVAGAVTDFIDFYFGTYHWHTFNIADTAITIGIVLIAWDTLRGHPEEAKKAAKKPGASEPPVAAAP